MRLPWSTYQIPEQPGLLREAKANLVYIPDSRTVRATQRGHRRKKRKKSKLTG